MNHTFFMCANKIAHTKFISQKKPFFADKGQATHIFYRILFYVIFPLKRRYTKISNKS